MIPYGRQSISEEDVDAVVAVLRSDFLTQGPAVPAFEAAVAGYCGAEFGVATNSATSALHIACIALGVGPNDWVWTSPITFAASANCAIYCGAKVDFVDIDAATYNLSPERLAEKLQRAEREGRLPAVVIPVHLCGQSCDMRAIAELGEQYGFKIIEDASHAVGGTYEGRPVGNCRHSDITVFSFHPVKIITTAEGGMAVTNDAALATRLRLLRSHGITRDPAELTRPSDGPWYYEQITLGFNYRLTDIHAALGLSQVKRLGAFVDARHAIARRYDDAFAGLPVTIPWRDSNSHSAFHLYVIRLKLDQIGKTHREVFDGLRRAGIGVNLHYIPVYRHPYYAKFGFESSLFPEAENYYAEAISLPMYAGLTSDQQKLVVEALEAELASRPPGRAPTHLE
jgi:UDP-4-amino-4,6-dideoxy-N-acetyl-beta-L-altrosamine transaminase